MADFEVPSIGGPGLIPGLGMIPHATTKSSHAIAKGRHVQQPRPSAAKKKKRCACLIEKYFTAKRNASCNLSLFFFFSL